ncbi:hypothetical protein GCM10008927_12680 [Amylibacter ulvae]|uniref:Peptidase inhibitor I78 family protein n=1 Tax=Paramylibacter ulvae TaxID=1651968 RepID=A0ABQ3CZM9_9RHOB|nr:I78 family peptidase inhibitor [Amylibacter ulvae]GHA48992.1 hypothetical protein GCM10008927_12680 [Amylibacter ulvae]
MFDTRTLLICGALVGVTACEQQMPVEVIGAPQECAADSFQHLLWQPQDFLNGVTLPKGTRVIGPDTAVTMDYRSDRMNIAIGKLGRIERIYCG